MHLYLLNKRVRIQMNEKLKMIAGILTEMVADNQAVSTATVTAEENQSQHVTETTEIEEVQFLTLLK